MNKKFLITGAIFGLLAVIIGAFGTHGLKPLLDEAARESFETGVKYQTYHALLFLILGGSQIALKHYKKAIYLLLLLGVIFFSGSIYLLATNALTSIDFKVIALITPLGGTLLIIAWILLLVNFLKFQSKKQ
ncbi:Uncharacterized membrane protein YgdD, TMEM256/DUF423 family [Salegentibacter echinorum]|uniref:Uncharacterized membrane protein YgdD, TMEM256/DUF423 family n=1 Tax=Salegentibacter echinorum TaxID=1073325 RepID=A0A1M5EPP7_SALEC|nr:DUF423 domain-containing protein [Salegentibacter echinorum]SHF81189.1 Uncharacterized membrane protein YgdD, TMEM256/DUF423 family [Salegentibacter echinorum]